MPDKKPISSLNAALVIFLVMVVFSLIINMGGFQGNTILAWLSYIIIIGGIMAFVNRYGKDMNNSVSFGNLFGFGFKTTAIVIIFFIAFSILLYLVFPEYKLQMQDIARQNALKNAKPENREQVEKGMEFFANNFWLFLIGGILFSFAILGAIGSLLGAAITKKEPNTLRDVSNQTGL